MNTSQKISSKKVSSKKISSQKISSKKIILTKIENKSIPKIIHQIWLGPRPIPKLWTDTWIIFCKKYNWKYYLWTDKHIEKFKLKNKKEYDNAKSFQQKSDILRYEILYHYGGIYLDVDMIWLGLDLEKYLKLKNFIGVQEPYSTYYPVIGRPYLANGFLGTSKKHPILKRCIDLIPKRINISNRPFISTGPGLLSYAARDYMINLIPETWIFPVEFNKFSTGDYKEYINKGLIFTKSGFEYPDNVSSIKNYIFNVIERLIKLN
jgi:mannosyltransferase OCH1-like enzyme